MSACVVTLGVLPACDDRQARKDLAEREQQIAQLERKVEELSARPGPPPLPTAPPPAPAVSSLDADIVRAAGSAAGVQKLKLECEADGSVREASLYHMDEAALPPAVLALREQQYPGSKLRAYETEYEREHGRLFEVEVTTRDGQECEYSAKPDGTLVYTECHVDAKTLSAGLRAALEHKLPDAEILEAEKKTYADGRVLHSVEVRAGGKVHELYFEDDAVVRHEIVVPAQLEVPAP
ncbi:MAG TPA: hypothetical protein VGB85_14860 [Nannocystis sp.]